MCYFDPYVGLKNRAVHVGKGTPEGIIASTALCDAQLQETCPPFVTPIILEHRLIQA